MIQVGAAPRDDNSLHIFSADFPNAIQQGAVSGYQSKLLLIKYENEFYSLGNSAPERLARWKYCEKCAQHLKLKSLESKVGKQAHMTEEEILDQYLARFLSTQWMSSEDSYWTAKRVTDLLSWPAPKKVVAFFNK
jgi:hypothetical protein